MKERGILFSAPMVRALLAGTKTQTRRLVKPPPTHFVGGPGVIDSHGKPVPRAPAVDDGVSSREIVCPYGVPGDRLWVRETWAHHVQAQAAARDEDGPFVYAADGPSALEHRLQTKWTPGIYMFRWASRITLEITDVRVERLQDISEADAWAEGCVRGALDDNGDPFPAEEPHSSGVGMRGWDTARDWYADLWEEINGAGSWDTNPWVWVLSVGRV
ncbi:hypothetical protein [Aquincola tertiaricarbonis]|uniref:hypothetical protein n=1 Tax=Aquincola tertiaricarbonis TaxID=391953 RepID=UPI000614AAB4|nr:hypothetical protein [Aquincola tertiaricarbonis]